MDEINCTVHVRNANHHNKKEEKQKKREEKEEKRVEMKGEESSAEK